MEIEIIPLASKKINLRKISFEWIKETILSPDQVVSGYQDRKIRQKIYETAGKKRLLRVIGEETKDKFIIISAYLTSDIKRYWR